MNNSVVLDLSSRYIAAFGMMAINKKLHTGIIENNNGLYNFEFYESLDLDIEKIVFSYQGREYVFSGMLSETEGVFAPPLMVDFYREKDLIETSVRGGNNVIVERWGTKPWKMDIRGILIDVKNRVYPQHQIEELTNFFEINDIIDVEGIQFEDKKINSIYFKNIRITPVEGFQDTIQFSLTASQINPAGFNILN